MTTSIADTDIPSIVPPFRLQWEEAQGCYVLLYPEGMVRLNLPAGEILSRCDGERTIADIVTELEDAFPDAADLRADVIQFLDTAHEQQWIDRRPA